MPDLALRFTDAVCNEAAAIGHDADKRLDPFRRMDFSFRKRAVSEEHQPCRQGVDSRGPQNKAAFARDPHCTPFHPKS